MSGVVMAALSCLTDFGINGVLLYDDYAALEGTLFRSPEQAQGYFIYMAIAYLLFGFALTWIYRQGKTKGAGVLAQGIRFGIAVAALAVVPVFLVYYAVQPMPGALVVKQCIYGTVAAVLLGIVVAYLNRDALEA
jgi:hypothetical protein